MGAGASCERQPIYEKDRMDPVDPAAQLTLDADVLVSFPEGYRHLAYLQSANGFLVKRDLPGLRGGGRGAAVREGADWWARVRRQPGSPL